MADPAVAAPGSGFVSDTAQVNGATLHYVRGGAGAAIILLRGFPEDWYAYHRIMLQLGSNSPAGGTSAFGARLRGRARYRWHGCVCLRPSLSGDEPRGDDSYSPIFLTPQFLGDPERMDNFVRSHRWVVGWSSGSDVRGAIFERGLEIIEDARA
jgi:hypothetical protein